MPFDVRKLQTVETSRKNQVRKMAQLEAEREKREQEKRLKQMLLKSGASNVQVTKYLPLTDEKLERKIA